MEPDQELHRLISEHLNEKAPAEIRERYQQVLSTMDHNTAVLAAASQTFSELSVEHEEYMFHYVAVAIIWMAGLLNHHQISTPEDVSKYAEHTWGMLQTAMQEIVDKGLESL